VKPTSKISTPGSARLFSDPRPVAPPAGVHIANIDGASRGNPGPASYAVVLRDPCGKIVLELAKNIGRETNNVAEYYALLAALDYSTSHGIRSLRVRSDSELLVRQMQGRYKVKSADLKPLHERASKLARRLEYFAIEHVPREMNREADSLANVALDQVGIPKFESQNTKAENRPNKPRRQTSSSAPHDSEPSPHASRPAPLVLRARFAKGALVPIEPLDLPEGAEVLLELRIPPKE